MTERERKKLWESILRGARTAVLDRLNPATPNIVQDEWCDSAAGVIWKGRDVIDLCAWADSKIASYIVGELKRNIPKAKH